MIKMTENELKAAREALDSMDDYARMTIGVDAYGPRKMLEDFINKVEAECQAETTGVPPLDKENVGHQQMTLDQVRDKLIFLAQQGIFEIDVHAMSIVCSKLADAINSHLSLAKVPDVVYVCSNRDCMAVHEIDPRGHCPTCKQENGSGWSTMQRKFYASQKAK